MFRLLAIDIDGTLVNSQDELTPDTRAALAKAGRSAFASYWPPVGDTAMPCRWSKSWGSMCPWSLPAARWSKIRLTTARCIKPVSSRRCC